MPIGVLTDRDIVIAVVARDLDARTIPVAEVMSTDVVAVCDDDSIKDALGADAPPRRAARSGRDA